METSGELHVPAALPRKRTLLDAAEKEEMSWPCRESNCDLSNVLLVVRRYTDCEDKLEEI
jgi:hypothetical protein